MTIVLDTNCLIQILPRPTEHRWLYDAILQGQITLSLSHEIILEYEETIDEFFGSKALGGNVARTLLELPKTKRAEIYYNWQIIEKDPDDNKYVDCAVASNADYIITNDRHFKVLKKVPFPKITCLTLEQIKKVFEKSL